LRAQKRTMLNETRDGLMCVKGTSGNLANYFPNSMGEPPVPYLPAKETPYKITGIVGRHVLPVTDADFIQPRELWVRVFDEHQKKKLVHNVVVHLGMCKRYDIVERAIRNFHLVDPFLARRVASGLHLEEELGAKLPKPIEHEGESSRSAARVKVLPQSSLTSSDIKAHLATGPHEVKSSVTYQSLEPRSKSPVPSSDLQKSDQPLGLGLSTASANLKSQLEHRGATSEIKMEHPISPMPSVQLRKEEAQVGISPAAMKKEGELGKIGLAKDIKKDEKERGKSPNVSSDIKKEGLVE